MSKTVVFDLDDLCDQWDPWDKLHEMKAKWPGLKVTLFAIPGRCSQELLDRYRLLDWVELGVHGYHHSTVECAIWGGREAMEKLEEIAGWWKGAPLFKAPGWVTNPEVYGELWKMGWIVADNMLQYENWKDTQNLRYVYNDENPFEETRIHGHTWDTMGNGPSQWDAMFAEVPTDAKFKTVTEMAQIWYKEDK